MPNWTLAVFLFVLKGFVESYIESGYSSGQQNCLCLQFFFDSPVKKYKIWRWKIQQLDKNHREIIHAWLTERLTFQCEMAHLHSDFQIAGMQSSVNIAKWTWMSLFKSLHYSLLYMLKNKTVK